MKSQISYSFIDLYFITNPYRENLKNYYPDFENWMVNKLIPQIILKKCFMITWHSSKNELIGFALLKKETKINPGKIQTLYITPNFQNKNYPKKILENIFSYFQKRPSLSVPEEFNPFYQKILTKYFGYSAPKIYHDFYRQGKNEYFYEFTENTIIETRYGLMRTKKKFEILSFDKQRILFKPIKFPKKIYSPCYQKLKNSKL